MATLVQRLQAGRANHGDLPHRAARVSIPKDVTFSGLPEEDYESLLLRVNDEAVAEGWTLDEKRRAAALTLQGAAWT